MKILKKIILQEYGFFTDFHVSMRPYSHENSHGNLKENVIPPSEVGRSIVILPPSEGGMLHPPFSNSGKVPNEIDRTLGLGLFSKQFQYLKTSTEYLVYNLKFGITLEVFSEKN